MRRDASSHRPAPVGREENFGLLASVEFKDDNGMSTLAGELRALEELSVGGTYQVCDDDLAVLAEVKAALGMTAPNCLLQFQNQRLRSVKVHGCPNVSDLGIKALAQLCPLEAVSVHKCPEVRFARARKVLSNSLCRGQCQISNEALVMLAACTSISLQHCQITSQGFFVSPSRFSNHPPRVIPLFQRLVSEAGRWLSGVAELDVSYNRGVTDDGIRALHLHLLQVSPSLGAPLVLYAHQTSVTSALAQALLPVINLLT